MHWMLNNLGTIVVLILLLLIVYGIMRKLVQDKKNGNSCCGGNCSHCNICKEKKICKMRYGRL